MAKSEQYQLLKKNISDVQKVFVADIVWFATELSDDDVAVLNSAEFSEATNPKSMLTDEDKAMKMFKCLLNRVDLDPDALGDFLQILRKKEKRFKVLIRKLEGMIYKLIIDGDK